VGSQDGEASEWDECNADGTYSYPPEPVCPALVTAFWRRCPIPDAVLAQVQRAYPDVRQILVDNRVEELHPAAPRPQEKMFNAESKAAAAWDAAHRQAYAEADAQFPAVPMPSSQVRTIVRAMRAVAQAGDAHFSDDEVAEVTGEPSGVIWNERETWGNLSYHYGRRNYADWAFEDPAVRGSDARFDELSAKIDQLANTVGNIKDGQDVDLLTRGKSKRDAERVLRQVGFTK